MTRVLFAALGVIVLIAGCQVAAISDLARHWVKPPPAEDVTKPPKR